MHQPPEIGLFSGVSFGSFDSFDEAVAAAGQWISDNGIQLIHVETVVLSGWNLPNAHTSNATGLATNFGQPGLPVLFWIQFVRVWYQAETEQPYR
jgi:hypothetical protein